MGKRFGYGLINSTWGRYDPQYEGSGSWGGWQAPLVADYNGGGNGGRVVSYGPGYGPAGVSEISPPATPLVATVLANGEIVITHANPETYDPVWVGPTPPPIDAPWGDEGGTQAPLVGVPNTVTHKEEFSLQGAIDQVAATVGIESKWVLIGGIAVAAWLFLKK